MNTLVIRQSLSEDGISIRPAKSMSTRVRGTTGAYGDDVRLELRTWNLTPSSVSISSTNPAQTFIFIVHNSPLP